MALAGGSARLIAGDILRLWGQGFGTENGVDGLPKAIRRSLGGADAKTISTS